jgi:hypothetical protein
MTDSRVKGHKFENDVCKMIGEAFNISVKRNLEQTRAGGADIELKPFLVECKRYAQQGSNWFKDDWWEQVKRASQNEFIPILVYKYDRQPIRVVLPLVAVNPDFEPDNFGFSFCENALRPVVTDWDTAAMVMREWLCDD